MRAYEILGRSVPREMDREALEAGVNTMIQIAAKLLGKTLNKDGKLLLEDKPDDESQE